MECAVQCNLKMANCSAYQFIDGKCTIGGPKTIMQVVRIYFQFETVQAFIS